MSTSQRIKNIIFTLPAFNEAEVIGELLTQIVQVLEGEKAQWTILVVDDGSTDATARIVEEAARDEARIRLIRHEKNRGLGPAIITGYHHALEISGAETAMVVGMDADLTHPPSVVPEMLREMESGADVVIASRFQPGSRIVGLGPLRRFLSWGARIVFSIAFREPGIRDYTCGYRAVRASLLVRAFERFGSDGLITRRGFACTDELLLKLILLGSVIREAPFTLRYDLKRGKSKIPFGVTLMETFRLIAWARKELKKMRAGDSESTSRPAA